jgi:transcriptional regulator with AAA-type ATPase domain
MTKTFMSARERETAEAISRLVYCNPFLAERVELERRVLGDEFTPFFVVWHPRTDIEDDNPNVLRIAARVGDLAERLRKRLGGDAALTDHERTLYQDVCLYTLYYRYHLRLIDMVLRPEACRRGTHAPFYADFRRDFAHLLGRPEARLPRNQTPEHVFACFFQIRRAFHFTFRSIAGGSMPAATLRARVWQSIFSHDLRRYQRLLYERMGDITTLITGPSGAGKELVARAIGICRYIPFDPEARSFRESFEESFFPLNLSALSPTLIESELFGHKRGSFTGAIADRKGWLEVCPPLGTVFLDEIGEVDASIQVKLLRVVETRAFQPLGTTEVRAFRGKVIAATNRDLGREMREGRFREDLYYRLCADTIVAPSLRERLADSPDELSALLEFLAERLVGEGEAPVLARDAETWIAEHLGRDYAWPGNVRELSHCLSNILIHRDYRPAAMHPVASWVDAFADRVLGGELDVDELLRKYCTLVYARTGSYVEAAERLGLDRRTVKSRVDPRLLAELRGAAF